MGLLDSIIPGAGIANALIQGAGRIIGKGAADRRKQQESDRLDAEYKKQADQLSYGFNNLKNVQDGQTSIDPMAQLQLNNNEKQASNAISQGTRSATNSNEAQSVVARATNNQLNQVNSITAAEGARRRIAAENAARTGLASQQALTQLDQQKQQAKRGAYQDVNQSVAADTDFLAGLGGDLTSAAIFSKMYGGDGSVIPNGRGGGYKGGSSGNGMNANGSFTPYDIPSF